MGETLRDSRFADSTRSGEQIAVSGPPREFIPEPANLIAIADYPCEAHCLKQSSQLSGH
jgi:hypothetical protein